MARTHLTFDEFSLRAFLSLRASKQTRPTSRKKPVLYKKKKKKKAPLPKIKHFLNPPKKTRSNIKNKKRFYTIKQTYRRKQTDSTPER